MLRIRFLLSILFLFLSVNSAISMQSYKVKKGDTLWKIAREHQIKTITVPDIVLAIKGINVKESPSIVDAIIKPEVYIGIPSNKKEVKEGIELYNTAIVTAKNKILSAVKLDPVVTNIKNEKSNSNNNKIVKTDNTSSREQNNSGVVESTMITQLLSKTLNTDTSNKIEKPVLNETNETTISSQEQDNQLGILKIIIWVMIFVLLSIWFKRFASRRKSSEQHIDKVDPSLMLEDKEDIVVTIAETQDIDISHITNAHANKDFVESLLEEVDAMLLDNQIKEAKYALQDAVYNGRDDLPIYYKLLEVFAIEQDDISFKSTREYLSRNVLPANHAMWLKIDRLYMENFK